MRITNQTADAALLRELGTRLARVRLARNWTQAQLAAEAGISKRTVERLESGSAATNLTALLRVARALGLLERLELVLPEDSPSPLEQWKLRGKQRRRASGAPLTRPAPKKGWTWGDEA